MPSLVTNVWQMFAGGNLVPLLRRLWPMLLGVCLGTWAGLLTGSLSTWGTALLGVSLMLYAIADTRALASSIGPAKERWLGLAGASTGLITAAAGVFCHSRRALSASDRPRER